MNWEKTKCPDCGEDVSGTLEEIEGIAQIEYDGKGGFQYSGQTDVLWDNQKTAKRNGEDVLMCPNEHEWTSKRTEG